MWLCGLSLEWLQKPASTLKSPQCLVYYLLLLYFAGESDQQSTWMTQLMKQLGLEPIMSTATTAMQSVITGTYIFLSNM